MNKILTTASLAALGAASLHAAYAPGLTPTETSKPWSVAASLRGFYDDNYSTRNIHAINPATGESLKRDSFGFEVNPSLALHLTLEQTYINLGYNYWLKYYDDRKPHDDQSHMVTAKLSHQFTERYKLDLSDTFVVAQEPALLEPSGPTVVPLRAEGNNIRNTGNANFSAELTRLLSLVLGYNNNLYDYEQTGQGSYSALLDRMEHLATLNLRWQAQPTTYGVLGYQFGYIEHSSNDSLDAANIFVPGSVNDPSVRDNLSHYVYVGVDHTFNPKLNGSVRVGGQFTDYFNAVAGMDDSSANPYADASLTWIYNPGSYLNLGVRHALNQTDVGFLGGTTPTLDQESTTVYANLNHRITAKLQGNLLAQYQHSSFNGGAADGSVDNYFVAAVGLSYQINKFLSAETGYSFDRLDSDINGRSYGRNRVYVGVRAIY